MTKKLKAPFPYFGGKSRIAPLVWERLGDVSNYIEPFFGSGAVLLSRPHAPNIETVNDLDCNVANFWRATQRDPEAVVAHADWPVSEVDLHARHRWLVTSQQSDEFRARMREDPDYYDAKFAGWWVYGICCWIGGGWCSDSETVDRCAGSTPALLGSSGKGHGVARNLDHRKPRIDGGANQHGHGIHGKSWAGRINGTPKSSGRGINKGLKQQLPDISGQDGGTGRGIHTSKRPPQRRPAISGDNRGSKGHGIHAGGRPQLCDAYSRGRGVNGNDSATTCADRRAWLLDWFGRLQDRFRTVRVCCGDWRRVCESESVTVRLGVTGIFLDAPYKTKLADGQANRDDRLYGNDQAQNVNQVVEGVIAYCVERGGNPKMRIAACCFEGEGYEILAKHGWECVSWQGQGGYGNRSTKGKANAKRERIWFSPHCKKEASLFE